MSSRGQSSHDSLLQGSSTLPSYSAMAHDHSPPLHLPTESTHSSLSPPGYAIYHASSQEIRENGDVISHDAHLNSDGEALTRFLFQQAEQPPTLRILCQGSRNESSNTTRMQSSISGPTTNEDNTTHEVIDFKFTIAVPVPIDPEGHGQNRPTLWSVSDREPVFRGQNHREVDTENGRCAAGTDDTRRWRDVRDNRRKKGLPPWGGQGAWKSSKSLRDWADAYCGDRDEGLKEFVFEKVVYGWDVEHLEESLRSIIREAGYWSGEVKVDISTYGSRVVVRPNRYSSRFVTDYVSDTSVCQHIAQGIVGLMIFAILAFILITFAFGPNRPVFAAFTTWPFPGDSSPRMSTENIPLVLFACLALFLILFGIGACILSRLVEASTRRWSICGAAYSIVPNDGTDATLKPSPRWMPEQDVDVFPTSGGQEVWLARWKTALKAGVRRGLVFSEVLKTPDTLLR